MLKKLYKEQMNQKQLRNRVGVGFTLKGVTYTEHVAGMKWFPKEDLLDLDIGN